jgi:hypothetical protein
MKPSRLLTILKELLKTKWPVFIWGPPGVGKSSIVRSVAAEMNLDIIDIRASLLDPTDLRGIPAVTDGKAVWCPPVFLPSDPESRGLLFFDELNAAPPLVQASLYQLVLDRRVGEYRLPDGWRMVAAGNRAEDASIVFRMPAALANRFIHLDFEVDVDDWSVWAARNGVHPLITAFVNTRRDLLFNMAGSQRSFPSPRSWEMLSDAIKELGGAETSTDVMIGIVGEGAALEFLGYCKGAISETRILEILENPEKAALPKNPGDQYALISYMVSKASEEKSRKAAGLLLNRLNPEFAVLLARSFIQVYPKFVAEKAFLAFAARHKDFLK